MREIRLNSKNYQITDEIIRSAINPFRAKLGATGTYEFSDFSQASLKEYSDFREGIGLYRELPDKQNRLWHSEGIDFTTARSAVLGGLPNDTDYPDWQANTAYSLLDFVVPTAAHTVCFECTTAGTSHATTEPTWDTTVGNTTADGTVTWTCRAYLATVKIIDFNDETYFIQNSRILKWDGTNLNCVKNDFANPIDAIVVTDEEDTWLIVSSATSMIASRDGSSWIILNPTVDNANMEYLASDGVKPLGWDAGERSSTHAYKGTYSLLMSAAGYSYLTMPWDNMLQGVQLTLKMQVWASAASFARIYLLDNVSDGDSSEHTGSSDWEELSVTYTVNAAATWLKLRCLTTSDTGAWFDNVTLDGLPDAYIKKYGYCRGYMSWYGNKFYAIKTDGSMVNYSGANGLGKQWTGFELTGELGTVYDLFEGKLLSTGEPTVYFCGTEGTFTIDITNQIAYRQEVNYPPLTYSGHAGKYWNGYVWVASGYGIVQIAPSEATYVGPDLDDGLPSGYQGYVYDLETVNNWLLFCVNGQASDKSSIYKRNVNYGGNLEIYTTSAVNKAIACIHHSPSSLYTNGRLWWGEGTSVKYMMFPDKTSNVKQVLTYEYVATSGYGKFPIFRELAVLSKTALGVMAVTKSCSATDYIEVFYGLNGDDPTTSLGTLKESPLPATLTFNSGLGTEFYTIQLATKMYRGGTAVNSPELESLVLAYFPTTDIIHRWQFNIDATLDTAPMIIDALETVRDLNTLVVFNETGDPNKTDFNHNVKLSEMPLRFWAENRQARRGYITVVVEEVFSA